MNQYKDILEKNLLDTMKNMHFPKKVLYFNVIEIYIFKHIVESIKYKKLIKYKKKFYFGMAQSSDLNPIVNL